MLGSGFARGLAHVGVIRTLAAAGIPIRRLVGVSSGALVGAGLARFGPDDLALHAEALLDRVWSVIRPCRPGRASLLSQPHLAAFLADTFGDCRLEELDLPLAAVATDLATGEPVLLRRGPVVPALLASAAVPGLYPPVRLQGRWLADGGLATGQLLSEGLAQEPGPVVIVLLRRPAEVRTVRRLNRLARLLLADTPLSRDATPPWWRVWRRCAALSAGLETAPSPAAPLLRRRDVLVLRPRVEHIPWWAFHRGRQAVAMGAEAARAALPVLRALLDLAGDDCRSASGDQAAAPTPLTAGAAALPGT